MNEEPPSPILSRLIFRTVQPTDIPRCYSIESSSYPPDEAASKSNLQYRQHHAASYFRCAFLIDEPPPSEHGAFMSVTGTIVGYICSTRCDDFTAAAMRHHDSNGRLLAIHSVAVDEKYRKMGVGSAMLRDYWEAMERLNKSTVEKKKSAVPMEKIVMMAKKELLPFYVRNGYGVTKVSEIVHGKDEWFELERKFSVLSGIEKDCYLIDAFVDPCTERRSGNPAGVVLLTGPPGFDVEKEQKQHKRFADSCESLDDIVNVEMDSKGSLLPARGCEWMSDVARELSQSETAFVWPLAADVTQPQQAFQHRNSDGTTSSSQQKDQNSPSSAYAIRYYTKTGVEVDLCGHATLASAYVLLNNRSQRSTSDGNSITFCAKNDTLHAELLPPSSSDPSLNSRISMNFPWKNVSPVQSGHGRDAVLDIISRAFFGARAATATNGVINHEDSSVASKFLKFFNPKDPDLKHHVLYMGTTDVEEDLFLELTEEGFDLLRGIKVNHAALCQWEGYSRGVIICCASSTSTSESSADRTTAIIQQPIVDFRSRFFGPKVGIDEDPVTGSAHCSLGPYFGAKLNKTVVVGRQESERGGLVECTLKPDEKRVGIVGTAVKTLSGHVSIRI